MAQEMKAYTFDDMLDGDADIDVEYYRKDEVDKVIAEKDKVIVELKKACNDKDDWCLHTLKENRHHKYKRCLDMAKLCNDKWVIHNFAEIPTKLGFYDKWEKRWLELAEKFKT